MAWVVMVAIFVGIGVDHERQARLDAQEREEARRRSERRYRDIFDAVAEPIVVLDSRRLVDAANFAALRLFGLDMDGILHRPLPGTLGGEIAAYLDARDDGQASTRLVRSLDPPAWIEPIVMTVQGADGSDQLQLLLLDVTTSHERERGLEEIARQTMLAREEEGRRIARELHDGPLQTLVALWRLLDGIESEQRPPGPTLERARTLTRSIAEELRRVSRDLRPSILDDLGLIAAVRSECDAFAERSRLVIEVAVTGSIRRLDPTLELALLRILQEAFRNIDSHAHATSVSVDVVFGPDDIRLSIADDGTGLDPIPSTTELLAADHLGLIGMRERARVSGAELSLRAVPHGGLMVEVTARTGGPRASSRG